ncbi:MAG TPA: hypothetical protein O0Y16_02260 [Methanocorpusculum sp.]|nr:hypothetical protein [Methanocorpusculum sp.]
MNTLMVTPKSFANNEALIDLMNQDKKFAEMMKGLLEGMSRTTSMLINEAATRQGISFENINGTSITLEMNFSLPTIEDMTNPAIVKDVKAI